MGKPICKSNYLNGPLDESCPCPCLEYCFERADFPNQSNSHSHFLFSLSIPILHALFLSPIPILADRLKKKEQCKTWQKKKYVKRSVMQIDNEQMSLIKINFNEQITIILHKQWSKQCQTGEFKFKQHFFKKEEWFH